MDGSLIVASVATAIAFLSFAVSAVALRYARRADRRAEADVREEKQAVLIAEPKGSSTDSKGVRQYTFEVRNIGRAPAQQVFAWIVDHNGDTISTGAGGDTTLTLDDPPLRLSVNILHPDRPSMMLMLRWLDGTGLREQPFEVRV